MHIQEGVEWKMAFSTTLDILNTLWCCQDHFCLPGLCQQRPQWHTLLFQWSLQQSFSGLNIQELFNPSGTTPFQCVLSYQPPHFPCIHAKEDKLFQCWEKNLESRPPLSFNPHVLLFLLWFCLLCPIVSCLVNPLLASPVSGQCLLCCAFCLHCVSIYHICGSGSRQRKV